MGRFYSTNKSAHDQDCTHSKNRENKVIKSDKTRDKIKKYVFWIVKDLKYNQLFFCCGNYVGIGRTLITFVAKSIIVHCWCTKKAILGSVRCSKRFRSVLRWGTISPATFLSDIFQFKIFLLIIFSLQYDWRKCTVYLLWLHFMPYTLCTCRFIYRCSDNFYKLQNKALYS